MPPFNKNGKVAAGPEPVINGISTRDRSGAAQRPERLAINLFDLDRLEPDLRAKLLAGRLNMDKPVSMDWDRANGKDEVAVEFSCNLLDAAMICDILRSQDKQMGDWPIRLYLYRRSWSRVPSNRVLTRVVKGKCVLSPELFPSEVGFTPQAPPEKKKMELGGAVKPSTNPYNS